MRRFGPLVAAVLIGGCATSSVVLLPGEGDNPSGKVVMLDPKTGADLQTLDTAGGTVIVSGSRSRLRSGKGARMEAKYRDLLGNLPEAAKRFVLYYPQGSSDLTPESIPVRDQLLGEVLRRGESVDIQIEGHTDRLGNDDDNIRLSRERAQATLEMLLPLGLKDKITRVVGRGETSPVKGHATENDIADPVNRRVEVVVR